MSNPKHSTGQRIADKIGVALNDQGQTHVVIVFDEDMQGVGVSTNLEIEDLVNTLETAAAEIRRRPHGFRPAAEKVN